MNDDPDRPELRETDVFEPGSTDAIDRGCRCPVLLNGPAVPPDQRLTAPDCPLHAPL